MFDDDLDWNCTLKHYLFGRCFGSEEPSHVIVLALDGTEVNGQWMYSSCPEWPLLTFWGICSRLIPRFFAPVATRTS